MASTDWKVAPASAKAWRTTGTIARRCSREANSGTTPPYGWCVAICDETTFESSRSPERTTAAAVSSQEVSIPRMEASLIGLYYWIWEPVIVMQSTEAHRKLPELPGLPKPPGLKNTFSPQFWQFWQFRRSWQFSVALWSDDSLNGFPKRSDTQGKGLV